MSKEQNAMLKIVDIKKKYVVADQDIWALKGINLEFRANEFVSILGPSGCGKTTMLNLIGGLDKYTEGDLVINGTSTKNFSDSDWDAYRNNSIGFVFQSYNLIPHLTILGNVELALTLSGVSKSERTQRATEVLGKVGLADHITKKPNQLSGGQMQRVAIARALINNPDIILADEPTGALDSETSVQIMDLLKEVAKEKLVIMVTHNPELADEYSSRIVKFKDGLLIEDSNPFKEAVKEESTFKPKKTAMPFKMALTLSFKNLLSKKARTIITAFAGSIGIIGISCVLALSTGFQNYVDKMQMDMMSEYPLELKTMAPDMEAMMGLMGADGSTKFPVDKDIFVNDTTGFVSDMMHYNKFTSEFIEHMRNTPSEYVNDINMLVNYNLNLYKEIEGEYKQIQTGTITTTGPMDMMGPSSSNFGQLINNTDFINNQYDILAGKYPTEKNELVILVDEYNMISDTLLVELGILATDDDTITNITFDDILKHEYKWVPNQIAYTKKSSGMGSFNKQQEELTKAEFDNEACLDLKIVGIMRMNKSTTVGAMSSTIGYTSALTEHIIQYETATATKSDIVKYLEETDCKTNPFTGLPITDLEVNAGIAPNLEYFAASTDPSIIKIYPKTFETKGLIKDYIEEYNVGKIKEDKIFLFDSMEMMVAGMNTVIASISYVLIAFTSISLIVSSVMIGIITYVSVIERTKEIGVLRSIGARKKDISRVFNAETIIIGFTAGLIAVTFTYVISIPINIIVNALIDVPNIANLNPIAAIILIIISISLTLIAGLVPSRIAAKKDPVTALRSE